jgi:hypothetical protein
MTTGRLDERLQGRFSDLDLQTSEPVAHGSEPDRRRDLRQEIRLPTRCSGPPRSVSRSSAPVSLEAITTPRPSLPRSTSAAVWRPISSSVDVRSSPLNTDQHLPCEQVLLQTRHRPTAPDLLRCREDVV